MTAMPSANRPRAKRLIRPGRPRLCTTYKLVAQVGNPAMAAEKILGETAQRVIRWLGEKAPQRLPPEASALESFILEEHGQRIECISLPDHGLWSCRFSHPDSGLGATPAVPGRHWTIDIALLAKESQNHFGIQVTCASLAESAEPIAFIRPGLVKDLAKTVGLADVRRIDGQPWILQTEADLETLELLLTSENRSLPLILISQPDTRHWEYTPTAPAYMLDANWLGRELIGYAHVVCLPWKLGFEWTRRVGKEWSVFDGAVRLYLPGLDLDEDSYLAHPLYQKDRIRWFKFKEHHGEKGFGNFLFYQSRSFNVQSKVNWRGALFITDARLIQAEARTQNLIHSEQCVQCKSQFERQIEAFKLALEEARNETEKWSDESVQACRDREHYERENSILRNQIDSLRANLEAKTGRPADAAISIPDNYDDMPEWVERHLAGRLILHPRAVRALKSAAYEDVELVYKALLVLANEYRDVRMGKIKHDAFKEAALNLKLDSSGSIDRTRAGAEGDEYFVKYPVGTEQRQFLEMHLRKGSTKDDRYCLAIYYFWDEDTRQVVVGWLPSHLSNRMT